MSRYLSELLGAAEPAFSLELREFERAGQHPKADIHLIEDVIQRSRQKSKELGLDPADTTGKELYHALQGLAKLHDSFVVKAIGGTPADPVNKLLPKLKRKIDQLALLRTVWVLKTVEAKKLLKKMPPKKVMKQLNYRSIDSLLKRENTYELMLAIRFAETKAWQDKFVKQYRSLGAKHFENRAVQIIVFDREKWGDIADHYVQKQRHNLVTSKEMGVIGLLPLPVEHLSGAILSDLALTLHYINELRVYGAYFKFQQVKPDFGDILVRTLIDDNPSHIELAGKPLHWRVVQRGYGSNTSRRHPGVFDPHIQPEDLAWHSIGDNAFRIEPALVFWQDIDYVGVMYDDHPVSFNLLDAAINYCNGLPYGHHASHNMRTALQAELYARYATRTPLEESVMSQLDEQYGLAEEIIIV